MTVPSISFTRIDTLELKALIVRRIGHQRTVKYFEQLKRFISLKISKSEFNRSCIKTIGGENMPLHNQLMRALLKNARLAKVPPPRPSSKIGSPLSAAKASNGDHFSPSLRRNRFSVGWDGKFKEWQSPLRPLGKPHNVTSFDLISKALEQQSATELHSLGSRPPVSVEDGEEVEQMAGSPGIQSRSPVTAPFGISMNFGCGRKHLSNALTCPKYLETCQGSGELPDTSSLRRRLEQKLEKEGLSVSVDCVNLLNNSLDAYLKRLIESSLSLAGSKQGSERLRQLNGRSVPGSNSNGSLPGRHMQTVTNTACTSLKDFRLAMELNPQILGPDWSIQLEKICLSASEE